MNKPKKPPFDGSPQCPMCPEDLRNLYAVAHNMVIRGPSRERLDDLARAVTAAEKHIDAHFADSMHSHGTVNS